MLLLTHGFMDAMAKERLLSVLLEMIMIQLQMTLSALQT